ncbi:MAG TPA: alpha/beta fold hydrolase [Thermoanaerobaculia bacterium]|nr:alpha/beta fold hydrolase [Thermoanaerobaculia bacterium]
MPVRRERLETPDGDELWIDHVDGPAGSPRLLILHGLEGSSFSVYAQGLLGAARRLGWRASALNFRSCARDPAFPARWIPNLRARLYHSGETSDLAFVVSRLASRDDAPFLAAGVSLGGNVLLKWLGENPGQRSISAAAAVSVPYDLGAGGRYMESGLGPRYVAHLLRTLKLKAADHVRRFAEAAERIDLPRALRAGSFYEFDDAATAPLHGFAGARDYYARSSSLRFVGKIATPTLAISSDDDPFLPASVLDAVEAEKSPAVTLWRTKRGGHVGFVGGGLKPRHWAEEAVMGWFARRESPSPSLSPARGGEE